MTRPDAPGVASLCRCGHSMFLHTLTRLGRRRRCTHTEPGRACPCLKYEPADEPAPAEPTDPRVYALPGPPPRDDDALLEDRHGDTWVTHGTAEWRRVGDGYHTTWPNLLGLHGPITLKSRSEVTRAR